MSLKYYKAYTDKNQKNVIDENWDLVEVLTSAQRNARHEQEPFYIFEYDEYENNIELDGRLFHREIFLTNPKLIMEHII